MFGGRGSDAFPLEASIDKFQPSAAPANLTVPPAAACFQKVELKGERVLEITYRKDQANAGQVLAAVQGDGYGIVDVSTREPDLEDVFLNLTRAANAG